jgi:hypothetical protein
LESAPQFEQNLVPAGILVPQLVQKVAAGVLAGIIGYLASRSSSVLLKFAPKDTAIPARVVKMMPNGNKDWSSSSFFTTTSPYEGSFEISTPFNIALSYA